MGWKERGVILPKWSAFLALSLKACAKVNYSWAGAGRALGWLWQWPVLAWQKGHGLHYPKVIICWSAEQLLWQNPLGAGLWQVFSAGHQWLLTWAPSQGTAQPTLAGSRAVLLSCLSVKEKLEKDFLGIWLDVLLFSKGRIAGPEGAGSNYSLWGRELCHLCSLGQKSRTFEEFCVSCRAEITELLPLEPLCQGCSQDKAKFTARGVFLRERNCPGLTRTCYLFTKHLKVYEWNCKSEKLGCSHISCSCHWGKCHTALFHAGEWKGKGLGSAALSEMCGMCLGAVPASPWTGCPWTTTVLPQPLPRFYFYFTSLCL